MGILKEANFAFINKDYNLAIELYEQAIVSCNLRSFIEFNLSLCKKKLYEQERKIAENLHNFSHSDSGYEGHLDHFSGNSLSGWMVEKSNSALIFDLKIKVNGVLFCTAKNDCRREDLVLAKKATGLGGFSVYLPNELFDDLVHSIEVYTPDDHLLAQVNVPQQSEIPLHSHVRIPAEEPVSIIVPIYNAPDDLEICVQRLLKYTRPSVDIILIDDASPDERIQGILQTAQQHKNIRVFKNEHNLGFTKTVNRGIGLAGNNDVVFLNSDARVTPRWLEGLKAALSTDAKIATVTPMSDRAGAFSAPNIGNENDLPDRVKEEDYAVAFRRRSYGFYPTVPTGNGFCLYVRRRCINEIGALDEQAFPRGYGEENDFCMRARAAGWRNVIDDRTYVFHDRNKSFGGEREPLIEAGRKIIDERYPDYTKAITVFSDSPLINLARFRARVALNDTENSILPRGLFVISTLTGGTPQTNRDLMLALQGKIEPWLLHCDSKVMSLYRVCEHKADDLIEQYMLKEPIDPLTHTSSEYDQVMAGWLTKADFEFVHIRHLAWHSLSLPSLAKKAGSKVIMSFHDYYAVCPTVKLLDNERTFCGGKCTASSGKCVPELWGEESFPYLKNNWVYTWRDKFKAAVQICDAYITTHGSAKETIVAHLGVDESKFHVIPHGRNFHGLHQLAEPYQQGDVLKILVPGNINDAKGSNTILELLELDKNALLEFHILGNAIDFGLEHPRLIIHEVYQRDDFAKHVKKIKPHIGAVLSIWNETWCHTLTELWSVGLPVIVTDFPTVSQRVLSSGGGWVVDNQSALEIFHFIENLLLDSTAISNKVEKVKALQYGSLLELNNHFMAKKYLGLY